MLVSGKPDTALAHKQLSQHLIKTAEGNFLYLRMILDLIDNGSLIPKSAGFTTFPRNLHEVSDMAQYRGLSACCREINCWSYFQTGFLASLQLEVSQLHVF